MPIFHRPRGSLLAVVAALTLGLALPAGAAEAKARTRATVSFGLSPLPGGDAWLRAAFGRMTRNGQGKTVSLLASISAPKPQPQAQPVSQPQVKPQPQTPSQTKPQPKPQPQPQPPPPPAPGPYRPFAASSFWNAPLQASAALDPLSADYNAELRRQLTQWLPWINTTEYSSPVYTVPAGQPTVRVKLENNSDALQAAWEQVPIPPNAQPARGTDHTMIVLQPSTDTMWEFWLTEKRADGWHATWGGRMQHVSTSPGYYTDPPTWGATATSIPMLGGLVRLDELRAGHIDHALALAIPEARSGVYSWPAQRTDGRLNSPTAIPEGTRFRIDPTLDLSSIRMAPTVRMLAEAAQRYGMVVRDTSGSITFYAEDPTPTGTDPFTGATGYFQGQYPSELLAQFPWQHLQALRTELHPWAG